jgi:hypothetical protein
MKDRIIIGYDTEKERMYQVNLERKEKLFNEVYDYCSQYVKDLDKDEFSKDILGYFTAQFVAKYKNEFPPFMSASKMLEVSEISADKIGSLQKQYEAINIESEPDFNLYLSGQDRIKKYEALNTLCDQLNTLKQMNIKIVPAHVIRATHNKIKYDWNTQQLTVNPYAI